MLQVDHVGLTVESLEESVAFYRDVVGMREVFRTESGGAWFDRLTGSRGAQLLVAHLALEEAFTLQLVQYRAGGGTRLDLAHRHVGNPHFCLRVDDVLARYDRIRGGGRYRVSPLVDIAGTGLRSFYVTDPDGVLVEFLDSGPAEPSLPSSDGPK